MELPIRVMIVLFVALVVGSMIILFARNIVDSAKREMIDIGKVEPEQIIDKGGAPVSLFEIVYLAQSCYESRIGKVSGSELCYLVHGNIQTDSGALDTELSSSNIPHTVESFAAGINSLSMYYEASHDRVAIKR